MAYTTMAMELVRVTVLDEDDRLVFDLLVRPEGEIYDLNTRFSGITARYGLEPVGAELCLSSARLGTISGKLSLIRSSLL